MNAPEFSRTVDIRHVSDGDIVLEPDEAERRALAERFNLVSIDKMVARLHLHPEGNALAATGRLTAAIVQSCAVSAEDLSVAIDEPIALRFVPAAGRTLTPQEEIELSAEDLDEVEIEGSIVDLGEAAAQTLSLAIDPFLTGPGAEEARAKHGLDQPDPANPFSVLKGLQSD